MLNLFKDAKFIVSMILLSISGGCIFYFPESNPHMILGTNIISGVGGYWLGSSMSSANKDKMLFGGKINETKPDISINSNSTTG